MRKVISAAAVGLVATLTACATILDGEMKSTTGLCSNSKEHCINVYLDKNNIEVDVPELYVIGPNHKIFWQLDPATAQGYRFPENGIVFAAGAQSEFPGCRPISGGQIFSCKDTNSKPGTYKYTINLTGPRPVPALDPIIKNG